MKNKNLLLSLSMIGFSSLLFTSCNNQDITETEFAVTEPKLKEGMNLLEGDFSSEYEKYFEVLNNSSTDNKEELAPYMEKLEKFRNSILKDYDSYTLTSYSLDKKTNRITYEKSILDFKTFNIYYSLNSYIEFNGKKENSINLVSNVYRKDTSYTVVSDISLDSFEMYKVENDSINKWKLSGTGNFFTTFESPRIAGNYDENSITDDNSKLSIQWDTTWIGMDMEKVYEATKVSISSDYSYSYIEYSNDYVGVAKSVIEDYLLKSSSFENDSKKIIRNYSLNKGMGLSNKEPNLDGYIEYGYQPSDVREELLISFPLTASPYQPNRLFDGNSYCYNFILHDTIYNTFDKIKSN